MWDVREGPRPLLAVGAGHAEARAAQEVLGAGNGRKRTVKPLPPEDFWLWSNGRTIESIDTTPGPLSPRP